MPPASFAIGRGCEEGGKVLEAGLLGRSADDSVLGASGRVAGTTTLSPLYFFQQAAQRHSTTTAPVASLRRVRRQPNDLLMRV
jgi:hypothetical protein